MSICAADAPGRDPVRHDAHERTFHGRAAGGIAGDASADQGSSRDRDIFLVSTPRNLPPFSAERIFSAVMRSWNSV